MKKISIALLAMLIIALIFTSCSNSSNAPTDVLVDVKIEHESNSRSLGVAIDTSDEGLEWHYSAKKVSEKEFKHGETADAKLPEGNTVTLSQGTWDFGLWAIKDGKKVYSGTSNNVLIKKNIFESNVSVVIPVSSNTGDKGYIVFDNVTINLKTNDDKVLKVVPNYVSVDGVEKVGDNVSSQSIECSAGSHEVIVAYKDTEGILNASKTINVTVNYGRPTTISGSFDYVVPENLLLISNAQELMDFASSVNNGNDYKEKTIMLIADIDLSGKTWKPIGYSSRSGTSRYVFRGTFNGQNHTITNIKYNEITDNMPSGFFGTVEGATISNLIIGGTKLSDDSYVYDGVSSFNGEKDSAAGVVSFVIGTGDTVISNCKNYATISGAAPAGIVSRLYNTGGSNKIINCYNFGVIDGKNSTGSGKAGGIVAITQKKSSSNIINCHNYEIVETYDFNAGGIIGFINPGCIIKGCTNNAKVSNENALSSRSAGGIVGWVADTSSEITISVSDCKNVGQILSDGCAGGIAGRICNQTTIDNCTNDGVVSNYANKNNGYAGGIVGNNDGGTVKNCINTATVSGVEYSGGVVGYWGFTSNISGSINNCSGGTEDITIINGTNKWAGRIIGCANCVYTSIPFGSISIDDSNTDKYENGLKTIGLSTFGTLKDVLTIESGTLHGLPGLREDPNQSVHTIIFKQNTKLIEDDITYNFKNRDVEINTMVDSGKLVWNTSSLSEFRVNS